MTLPPSDNTKRVVNLLYTTIAISAVTLLVLLLAIFGIIDLAT